MLDDLIGEHHIIRYAAWYYTPMAREFSRHLRPQVTVYDCMDELSAFAGAPPAMKANEQELFAHADLVFTGGTTLYEAKRKQHDLVYAFPSSVDVAHFAKARALNTEPEDQRVIPFPRIGYAGVIDERMDVALLSQIAGLKQDWHYVMLGPVVKIDPAILPKAANIHYLGMKQYADLPAYFSGWKIGLLPFALNESTRYISPTKTPEYLAAGLRVVSTPIRDVVTPYGDLGLAAIANNASDFVRVAERQMTGLPSSDFQARVDLFLAQSSWEKTWNAMNELMVNSADSKQVSAGVKGGRLASVAHV
ncbi:MAG: glycosyltransferase family 1 protein [Acidobacteriaceae bacterium]|nr:glycosyltransferase family 1 protein [Acidobacteriaceae bacterium]